MLDECDDEELVEAVLPRLSKTLTLWDFLLAKVAHTHTHTHTHTPVNLFDSTKNQAIIPSRSRIMPFMSHRCIPIGFNAHSPTLIRWFWSISTKTTSLL